MPPPWDDRPEPPPKPERWTTVAMVVGVALLFGLPLALDGSLFDKIPPVVALKVDSPRRLAPELDLEAEKAVRVPRGVVVQAVGRDAPLAPSWWGLFEGRSDACRETAMQVAAGSTRSEIEAALEARDPRVRFDEACFQEAIELRGFAEEVDRRMGEQGFVPVAPAD